MLHDVNLSFEASFGGTPTEILFNYPKSLASQFIESSKIAVQYCIPEQMLQLLKQHRRFPYQGRVPGKIALNLKFDSFDQLPAKIREKFEEIRDFYTLKKLRKNFGHLLLEFIMESFAVQEAMKNFAKFFEEFITID